MHNENKSPLTVLEFNSTTIRVCRSAFAKGKRSVTHCFSFEAEDSEDNIAKKITEQFSVNRLKVRNVILLLPRYAAISRLFRLPSKDVQEIKNMVALYIGRESFSEWIDNIAYDWALIGFDKDGYALVSVFIMQKERVDRYVGILGKAGISPISVTLNTAGLLNWSKQNRAEIKESGTKCIYLLNADHDTFDFNLLLAGHSIFSRTFSLPDRLDPEYPNRLNRELKVSIELSRRLSGPFFDHDSKLYVTGTANALEGLDLEGCFQQPVERFLKNTPVSYAAVVGMALEESSVGIDLTPQGVKKKNKQEKKFFVLKQCVRFVGLAAIAASILLCMAVNKKIDEMQELKRELVRSAALEKEAQGVRLLEFLEKDVLQNNYICDVLYELYRLTPEPVFLDDLKATGARGLEWTGTSPDAQVLFRSMAVLERSSYLKNVRIDYIDGQKNESDKKIKFKMRGDF